ncbi:MAG: alpha/beta fold hydrolase [Acidimicrobiia bacterium]
MTTRLRGLRKWVWFVAPQRIDHSLPHGAMSVPAPSSLDLPEEEVWLQASGGPRLHSWFIPVEGTAPAVVVLHGWGGNASLMLPLAPHLHRAGFHSLFLDVRNHGQSDRRRFVSMPRFADDLDVALGWLSGRKEVTTVGVVGHSVGGGAAILSASRGGAIQALVSVAAPADPGALMRQQMATAPRPVRAAALSLIQRAIGQPFDDFAPRNRIALVQVPTLLVHGAADEVVPIENLHQLMSARPGAEILIVADGGHSDLGHFLPHVGEITGFLGRHLRR